MYYKLLNENMKQLGYQYNIGLNVDEKEMNYRENSFGLHFADEYSVMSFIDWGDTYIAEIEIPDGEVIISNPHKYKAHRIIIKDIKPIWSIDTFKWMIEHGININENLFGNNNWLINYANKLGRNDVVHFLTTYN